MKRSRGHSDSTLNEDAGGDDSSTTPVSDAEQDDATYETDLSEPEDDPGPRKRMRPEKDLSPEPQLCAGAADFYEDPLDEGGLDLSDIPEDFDKAPGTIERRERIESRWKR